MSNTQKKENSKKIQKVGEQKPQTVSEILAEKKVNLAKLNQKDKLRDYLLERKESVNTAMVDMQEYVSNEEKSIFEDTIQEFPYSLAVLQQGAYPADTKKIMVIKKPSVVYRFSQILNEALESEIKNVENELTQIHV